MASDNGATCLPVLLQKHEAALLQEWVREQLGAPASRHDLMDESEVREQSREFLRLLREAAQGGVEDVRSGGWARVREMLADVSRSRSYAGFSPLETAMFVFSFKQPLFARLRAECGSDADRLERETWAATVLLDRLGLYTTEIHQQTREDVIRRQQQELLELSTPVVKLWDGILALPLIGALDSARTQIVMESLLEKIVETGSEVAIIDITGVPTVDTLTAQHLLKTVSAARLMGADCIISGIRPQIAQTVVHLGLDLSQVMTRSSLADAFRVALKRVGLGVTRT